MAILRDRSTNQSKLIENSEQGPVVTTTRAASLELVQRERLFPSLFPVSSHYHQVQAVNGVRVAATGAGRAMAM